MKMDTSFSRHYKDIKLKFYDPYSDTIIQYEEENAAIMGGIILNPCDDGLTISQKLGITITDNLPALTYFNRLNDNKTRFEFSKINQNHSNFKILWHNKLITLLQLNSFLFTENYKSDPFYKFQIKFLFPYQNELYPIIWNGIKAALIAYILYKPSNCASEFRSYIKCTPEVIETIFNLFDPPLITPQARNHFSNLNKNFAVEMTVADQPIREFTELYNLLPARKRKLIDIEQYHKFNVTFSNRNNYLHFPENHDALLENFKGLTILTTYMYEGNYFSNNYYGFNAAIIACVLMDPMNDEMAIQKKLNLPISFLNEIINILKSYNLYNYESRVDFSLTHYNFFSNNVSIYWNNIPTTLLNLDIILMQVSHNPELYLREYRNNPYHNIQIIFIYAYKEKNHFVLWSGIRAAIAACLLLTAYSPRSISDLLHIPLEAIESIHLLLKNNLPSINICEIFYNGMKLEMNNQLLITKLQSIWNYHYQFPSLLLSPVDYETSYDGNIFYSKPYSNEFFQPMTYPASLSKIIDYPSKIF